MSNLKSVGTHESMDGAVVIKQEVQRLENNMTEAFRLFHEKRADLLWRLNTLQASTKNVPWDVLARIFMMASDDHFNHQRMPLKLGGICSYWRQITLSTPCLWSSLTLFVNENVDTEERRQNIVNLLQYYMENVGLAPFAPSFKFDTHLQPSKEILNLFTSVLLRKGNARKVHALEFVRAPFEWIYSFPQFPNLKNLEIHDSIGCLNRTLILPLAKSPHLRDLSLYDLHFIPKIVQNNVEQTQITRISLVRVHVAVCISLLVRCPNLTHFESVDPVHDEMQGTDDLQAYGLVEGPIILHKLEHFGWAHPGLGASRLIQIYPRLRFPSLHTFRWYANRITRSDDDALHALVPNLPRAISCLQVFFAQEWSAKFINLMFTRATTVQELRLQGCDYITLNNMVIALGQKRAIFGSAYLPQLRRMAIDGFGQCSTHSGEGEADSEAQLANQIMNTLRHRCQDPSTRFLLYLSRHCGTWTKDVQEVFLELQKEGIEIELWWTGRSGTYWKTSRWKAIQTEPSKETLQTEESGGG